MSFNNVTQYCRMSFQFGLHVYITNTSPEIQ